MADPLVIAIDGPAGSGKSSVSREVARRLGFGYLDTGAVYRALAWHCLRRRIDTSDAMAVVEALADFDVAVSTDPAVRTIRVRDADVTDAIREPAVTDAVSGVARVPVVRRSVNAMFRSLIRACALPGIVVEGRDITTVVAPEAPVRILLTASEGVRALRRGAESPGAQVDQVVAALRRRDGSDAAVAEFRSAAEGVRVIDSTDLDFEGTVAAVLAEVDRTAAREVARER